MYKADVFEVPVDADVQDALRQQSTRTIQRMSLIARFDIVVYNPPMHQLQVWARKDGRNLVILNHEIQLKDKKHFLDLVQLIGKVTQLPITCEEFRVPDPWWAYRFV